MACLDGQVHADRPSQQLARQVRVTSQGCVFVGSPVSKQSAHHSAYQSTWTTAVMVNPPPAATTGRTVVIGFVAIANTGARRRDKSTRAGITRWAGSTRLIWSFFYG